MFIKKLVLLLSLFLISIDLCADWERDANEIPIEYRLDSFILPVRIEFTSSDFTRAFVPFGATGVHSIANLDYRLMSGALEASMTIIGDGYLLITLAKPLAVTEVSTTDLSQQETTEVTRIVVEFSSPEQLETLKNLKENMILASEKLSLSDFKERIDDVERRGVDVVLRDIVANPNESLELLSLSHLTIPVSIENVKNYQANAVVDLVLQSLTYASPHRLAQVPQGIKLSRVQSYFPENNPLLKQYALTVRKLWDRFFELDKKGWLDTLTSLPKGQVSFGPQHSAENIVRLAPLCRGMYPSS